MRVVYREDQQQREHEVLSEEAAFADGTEGRRSSSEPDALRTDYQRDRDKILHSKSFRRLSHKTQVFLQPEGDHYRTRMTHTLEVSRIARTIARGLALNEDLTEAIALGHDLGHTPFGHAGERVLNEIMPEGFQHNVQSLRVVDRLEKNGQGRGMLVDFGDLKKDLRELADSMDHTLIYEENTLRPKTLEALDEEGFHLVKVPFRPTAENFSEYFFRKMEEKGYPVKRAVVYETPNNCAAYRETEEETEAVWL